MQLDTPEWGSEADGWFRRSIHRLLCGEYLDGLPRACRDEPELLDAIVDVLADRHAAYVRWVDAPWFDPVEGAEGRWVLDLEAINRAPLWSIAEALERQRDAEREAERFPTLDAWLAALAQGKLGEGPREPHGADVLPDGGADLWTAARKRQRAWPRRCKVCGNEFRPPDRRRVARCSKCLGNRQRTR